MITRVLKFFRWIFEAWQKTPEPVKEKIIAIIVDGFEVVFREYYRKSKEQEDKEATNE